MNYPRQSILFISGLDKTANETILYQLFNEFPISYIKIAKDHNTRESYGYAFVGFKNHSKAEEALIKLNYSKVLKKSIRISWYNREPNNYRAHPEYNVFVKKLHKEIKAKEFHDYFSKFGNIISAKLAEDEEGENMGYGFVLFDNEESAKLAIKEGNGSEWKGKKIFCGQFVKNRPKRPPQFNTVYVKNLNKNLNEEDIKKLFSGYGEVLTVFVKEPDQNLLEKLPEEKRKDIVNHKFAFITFKNPESASRLVNEQPFLKINDKEYNKELLSIVDSLKQSELDARHHHRFACYLIENENEYKNFINDKAILSGKVEAFKKYLLENDDNYVVQDKTDRYDCCQALKKKERIKKLKILFEKIKKQIKEKYRFCNLYVKNLPDNFDEEQLKELFSKHGQIRSCKTVRKELLQSYLGIKRSVKVFGYVCYFDAASAQAAKQTLNSQQVFQNAGKLFVDYHKSKQERAEYLKLKMLNDQKNKKPVNFPEFNFPGMMPGLNPAAMKNFAMFGPQMLRKFPHQSPFMRPPNPMNPPFPQPQLEIPNNEEAKKEFYGERLYSKLVNNPNFIKYQELFSKVVGILLDLDENYILKLIQDDGFFMSQVSEAIRQLTSN